MLPKALPLILLPTPFEGNALQLLTRPQSDESAPAKSISDSLSHFWHHEESWVQCSALISRVCLRQLLVAIKTRWRLFPKGRRGLHTHSCIIKLARILSYVQDATTPNIKGRFWKKLWKEAVKISDFLSSNLQSLQACQTGKHLSR